MFRPVVNSSDESGRRLRVWQVGFLAVLLTRRSPAVSTLIASYYNKRSSVIRVVDLFSITGVTQVLGDRIGGLR
jgi:hypothetical protein